MQARDRVVVNMAAFMATIATVQGACDQVIGK